VEIQDIFGWCLLDQLFQLVLVQCHQYTSSKSFKTAVMPLVSMSLICLAMASLASVDIGILVRLEMSVNLVCCE
jgi:hypothetical protein